MRKYLFSLSALALLFISCQTRETDMVDEEVIAPDIVASVETDELTRTLIEVDQEGEGTIYWTPADQINIFYGTVSTLYTSRNTENATTAVFRTTDIIGSTESASTNIWGLYPYDENATCDGSNVTTTLPATQHGVPETFDDDLYITLAHSTTNALKFYNVCGGVKFSLSREDIASITFRGNNDEDIAGDISLTFVNDLPKATVVNGLKEITLTPKTGTTFAKEVNYYLILLPGTLSGGFTMTFTTSGGAVGTFNYTANPITIKRSIFSRKAEIDTYATFTEVQPIAPTDFNPNSYLVYRANKTEYDTDGDWYSIESHMPGIWGAKIEMKFQLASGSRKTIGSDNTGSDYSCAQLFIENGNLVWNRWEEDGDCFNFAINLVDHGLSETDLMILRYDSVLSTFSVNNYTAVCNHGSMSFGTLFARYYSEYDEGRRTFYDGIPDGSKLYYVKAWDENDALICMGYATTAVNPTTNQTEYCWCCYHPRTNEATYYFANDAIHQGGYLGITASNATPEAVDLGLPVKWASFNLGATSPEEFGDYFAWGEIEPYYNNYEPMIWKPDKNTGYTWESYRFNPSGDGITFTKYNGSDSDTLLSEDDAARVIWGGNWRIPTYAEWEALRNEDDFTWEWTSNYNGTGVAGRIVTSKIPGYVGNSIFLPAAGVRANTILSFDGRQGWYWTATHKGDSSHSNFYAWGSYFSPGMIDDNISDRYDGQTIRPVCD